MQYSHTDTLRTLLGSPFSVVTPCPVYNPLTTTDPPSLPPPLKKKPRHPSPPRQTRNNGGSFIKINACLSYLCVLRVIILPVD